jgi:hypothetical protein
MRFAKERGSERERESHPLTTRTNRESEIGFNAWENVREV